MLKYAPDLEYVSRWIHKLPWSTIIQHRFRANYAFLMKLPNLNNFFLYLKCSHYAFCYLGTWIVQDSVSCTYKKSGKHDVRTIAYMVNPAGNVFFLLFFYLNWNNCLAAQFSVGIWKALQVFKVEKPEFWLSLCDLLAVSPMQPFSPFHFCDNETCCIREVRARL